MSASQDVERFTSSVRTALGYTAFYRHVEKQCDAAVHLALYGPREDRDVNAGRAQAWREVLKLLKPPSGV